MNFKLVTSILLLFTGKVMGQQLIEYQKPLFDYDAKRPIIEIEGNALKNENGLLRFSVLTGYREGVRPTKGAGNFESNIDLQNHTSRLYMMNLSIQDMLTMGYYKNKDIILEVKDPSKYRYDLTQGPFLKWMRKNAHCFEFMVPYGGVENIFEVLKTELSHYFGVTCKLEKRMMEALILVRTSGVDKIKSKGKGEGSYDMKGYFNNVPIGRLGHPLFDAEMPPLVDETGYKNNIDLDLKIKSWEDIPALRRELQKYDLDIKQEKRPIDKFVIREVGGLNKYIYK